MKKIDKFWKESLRNKGVIIGTVFGLLIMVINIINSLGIARFQALYEISGFLIQPIAYIIFNLFGGCKDLFCLALILPIYLLVPVFYGLIGFLIGYSIERIKKSKKPRKNK